MAGKGLRLRMMPIPASDADSFTFPCSQALTDRRKRLYNTLGPLSLQNLKSIVCYKGKVGKVFSPIH